MKSREIVKRTFVFNAATLLVATAAVLTCLSGCSRTGGPETAGSITLHLDTARNIDGVAASPEQVSPDSVAVSVFRGGQGIIREVSRGVAIDAPGPIEITVSCIAENSKKVSVELFEAGKMRYFGVDENVDVAENRQTDVLIAARDIYVDLIDVTPQVVVEGTAYTVTWSGVPAAASYLLIESTGPGFEQPQTQSYLTTATEMTFQRGPGAYYYMVAPLNAYTVGALSAVVFSYVQSVGEVPPGVDSVEPVEAPPGALVVLSGSNLDLPGSRVFIGSFPCQTVRAEESKLTVRVPLDAHSGDITVQTVLGTVDVPVYFVVDRIAYVTSSGQDEAVYKEMLAGDPAITSGMAAVNLADVTDRDMTVFDLIVVANDLANGPVGPGGSAVQAIAESGASVLAVGAGGYAWLVLYLPEAEQLGISRESQRSIFVPDGTLPLFQTPYTIAPAGAATIEIVQSNQFFRGLDVAAQSKPDYVTVYAALSSTNPDSYVLLGVASATAESPPPVLYWGYEGDPGQLTKQGTECVLNLFHYLMR